MTAVMVFGATASLAACAPTVETQSPLSDETPFVVEPIAAPTASPVVARATPTGPRPIRSLGTGELIRRPLRGGGVPRIEVDDADRFSINLVNVPVEQAASAVLGDTLGLPFVVAEGATGTVTVQTSRPVGRTDLLATFEIALSLNGLAIDRRDGTFVVLPEGGATRRFQVANGRPPISGGVVIIPLSFIGAAEMRRILEPIASPGLTLAEDAGRNILFAAGPRREIEAVLEAVTIFDVDQLRGRSVSRVPIFGANPSDVAGELGVAFDTIQGGALEGVLRFIPNDALGSILIVSARPDYVREAEAWVRDYQSTTLSGQRVAVVYPLENREASDLAPVLNSLLSLGALEVEVAGDVDATAEDAAFVADGTGAGENLNVVVADDVANAVIAYASATQQSQISTLIRQLDDVDDQVLLEATIAEVSLNDALEFGVRYFFETGNFALNFTNLAAASAGSVFPGFNALFDNGDATVAINALAEVTDVSILSSPSLMVLDNREATLNVGDQVPIAVSSAVDISDPDAPIVNEIDYRDTGVILTVKPRVSSVGRVILDISQEVSDVVATSTSGIDSPTIQQRIVSTSVAVDSGQSLVIGGLIREQRERSQSRIPLLGDVPILGAAFRSTDDEDARTELLVIITPRVVRDPAEARRVTDEYRRALSRPDQLRGAPPSDPGHRLRRILF
ncbi:MAG: type II secretion system secretin GspD [Pseudomonadota bacterium]